VGVIPDDWDVKPLPEVCRIRAGKAHEQHISDLGRFICVNSKFIATDGAVRKHSSVNHCPAKKNDVLLVMSDLPNGRALAKAFLVDQDDLYAVNQRVCALTPYRDSAEYLFYVLNRNPYFLRFDDGVNQTHLLNRVFLKCPVVVPREVSEQRAIATALREVDALLDGLGRLVAKKRDLKQAAMQQLLTGETRLPGFSGGWAVTKIGELCEYVAGVATAGGEQGYVEIGDVDVVSKAYDVGRKDKSAVRGAVRVPRGTLLISTVRPTRGAIAITREEIYVSPAFCRLRTSNALLFHLVCQARFLDYLGENSIGGTYPTCRDETILSYKCLLPSDPEEQRAIAACFLTWTRRLRRWRRGGPRLAT
jgi:restriction endonuclease S subunit